MRITKATKTGVKASSSLRQTKRTAVDAPASVNVCATSDTDKALQHIKAAIDILGKSGDKTDVTKDSIANLAVVMFDLQENK